MKNTLLNLALGGLLTFGSFAGGCADESDDETADFSESALKGGNKAVDGGSKCKPAKDKQHDGGVKDDADEDADGEEETDEESDGGKGYGKGGKTDKAAGGNGKGKEKCLESDVSIGGEDDAVKGGKGQGKGKLKGVDAGV